MNEVSTTLSGIHAQFEGMRTRNHNMIILTFCAVLFWTPAILLRFAGFMRILPESVLLVFPFSGVALLLAAKWRKQNRLMAFVLVSILAAADIFFLQ